MHTGGMGQHNLKGDSQAQGQIQEFKTIGCAIEKTDNAKDKLK